jgi:hypothetical protein
MKNDNILSLIIVAGGLGDLLEKVVFIGGATTGLYAPLS